MSISEFLETNDGSQQHPSECLSKVNDPDIIWRFEDSLRSEPERASLLVRQVVAQLKDCGWQEHDVFAVHMALEEALMNAIKHGNCGDVTKLVKIVMQIRDDRFYARIQDQGQGFDPSDVPDPADDANLDKPCGRGVALIRNFVDFVEYNAAGNMVEFTKMRSTDE